LVDVRVDDHAEPVAELERIYGLWEERFMVQAYLESGRERELAYALPIIDRVLAANPDNADYHNNFAWALATAKRMPAKALELALRAHELAPDDVNIWDTVAEAYYAAGDYEQALAWEKKARAQEPDNEFFRKQLEKFEEAGAR
jgi:tetratricopeptide (TPR) repeat protein